MAPHTTGTTKRIYQTLFYYVTQSKAAQALNLILAHTFLVSQLQTLETTAHRTRERFMSQEI
jgi:hypothetical protein